MKLIFNRKRSLQLGLGAAALVVLGLIFYYGWKMIYKADTGITTAKNRGILTDSSSNPIGQADVTIQINNSPTP